MVSYFVFLCTIWLFFGRQYKHNQLHGKTCPQNHGLYVELDSNLCSFTHCQATKEGHPTGIKLKSYSLKIIQGHLYHT